MRSTTLVLSFIAFAFFTCKKPSSDPPTTSNTNSGPCLQSSLITSSVPVFSGPDSIYNQFTYNQYYTIVSDGTTADTLAHNTINSQNFALTSFGTSNCPGSYMNKYQSAYWQSFIANNFYYVNLNIVGPGDSALWRSSFNPGRYGVLFNTNSTLITDRWGTPVFSYSDSQSNSTNYTIDYKGISGVDSYHDIMEVKYLGRIIVPGSTAKSRFQMKGEIKLKMRQVEDTSITKNIRITYKEVFTIST